MFNEKRKPASWLNIHNRYRSSHLKVGLLALAVTSVTAPYAHSGAYMFNELGMMNISTAGAGAQAIAEGAETAFANPAAMAEFDSAAIAFNLQGMVSSIEYTDTGSTGIFANGEQQTQAGTAMPVASGYYVQPLSDNWHFGLALASAGGSVIDYGNDFSGAVLLQDAQLTTVQLTPSLAYSVNEQLSFGVGLVTEFGLLEQNFAGSDEALLPAVKATGDSLGFGYNISGFYKYNDKHQYGFIYRSQIDHQMEGDLSATELATNSRIDIVMPASLLVSGVHKVSSKMSLLWSAGWTEFSQIEATPIVLNNISLGIDRQWQDTYSASIGVHYQLTDDWRLESGVYYETSPQDDPQLQFPDVPTGEIWKLGLGATYDISEQWRMQMYYEYFNAGTRVLTTR
ncbi:OmpP1/FadL family transporter [Shewanella maritima]|uniref:OmpP1/FadL family transporter n=1 Tax=Shewanella maritima TaxID=2520507 RepID=UPI001A915317|nr:outer membrane protein transport protein [Shewanella maritima]